MTDAADATVISNVRVFDGKQLGHPTSVVLVDGLISAGPAPDGAELVDGLGGALLPGFIDTHVHAHSEAHLRAAADWGVTTMLDMGARKFDATMALRDRPGLPTLKTAGRPASGPGSMFITKMGFPPETGVSGPADAPAFIADRVAERSDYIKIIVEDPKFPGAKPLAPESIAAIVVAAHAAGLITVAHVVSAGTMRTAVTAGIDIVTHTSLTAGLDADFERLIASRPVTIIPTLAMMAGVVHAIGGKPIFRVLSVFVPALRLRYRYAQSTVATFQRAGKVVLVGTDSNDEQDSPFRPPHGEALHEELERLVGAGLTPVEALQGATSLAADVFGLTDRGVIAPGCRADLVLVTGDPTTDIRATRDLRGVWIGGVRVRATA